MSLVLADRVRETTQTTGTGTITLDGAIQGFQSFSVIGNNNTTYYTINRGSEWEVGLGTYYGGTLSRDTVYASSNGGSKVNFSAGAKDVFVTYPAEKSVNQDANNRVLIPYTSGTTNVGSLNVGNATAHTDSGVIAGFTASEPLYLYTSLQNTSASNTSYASYAVNDGGHTAYGELGINNANYSYSAAGFPNNAFSTPLASFVESFGGPLVLGSWDSQKISFIVNGAVNTADAMTIETTGAVTIPTAAVTGGTINGTTVGATTASTGAFTTLSASSTVSGTGFSTYLASPPAIGGTAASTGRFTTVTSTVATGTAPFTVASTTAVANLSIGGNAGTVTNGVYTTDTGTVTNTMLAGSIANAKLTNSSITFGSTAQALGSTVSAISGVTIDNGAIGGTTPAAGTFTTLTANSTSQFGRSSANYIQAVGAAASSGPVISSQGSDGNIDVNVTSKGYGSFKINNGGGVVAEFNDGSSGTPVNTFLFAAGASAGTRALIRAQGGAMTLLSTGTNAINFATSGASGNIQAAVSHTASAVNYVQVTGAATGGAPTISSQGSDANPNVAIFPKGLGIVLMNQQTPTAVTATGTLTIANLLTQIITSTSAVAVALTLPTGTLSDAGVSGGTSAVNTSFDWSIINTGSAVGDVTLVAGTAHTIVGSVTVAVGTTGSFRSRKTATNTFVTYRV